MVKILPMSHIGKSPALSTKVFVRERGDDDDALPAATLAPEPPTAANMAW